MILDSNRCRWLGDDLGLDFLFDDMRLCDDYRVREEAAAGLNDDRRLHNWRSGDNLFGDSLFGGVHSRLES